MTWTSEELVASSCFGTLTLGGTSMNNKAWSTLNNYVLWNAATRRGENSLIPDLPGRIAQPYRKDETIRTLECVIIGDCNTAGVAHANRTSGLWTNWTSLKTGILSSTATTMTASLVLPTGGTITGAVQIVGSELGETGTTGALTFTLDLKIPAGELS